MRYSSRALNDISKKAANDWWYICRKINTRNIDASTLSNKVKKIWIHNAGCLKERGKVSEKTTHSKPQGLRSNQVSQGGRSYNSGRPCHKSSQAFTCRAFAALRQSVHNSSSNSQSPSSQKPSGFCFDHDATWPRQSSRTLRQIDGLGHSFSEGFCRNRITWWSLMNSFTDSGNVHWQASEPAEKLAYYIATWSTTALGATIRAANLESIKGFKYLQTFRSFEWLNLSKKD